MTIVDFDTALKELRKAREELDRAECDETAARNRVIDCRNRLDTTRKTATQVLKAQPWFKDLDFSGDDR